MTLCFVAMLAVHVAGGTIALLAGPVAMLAPKGRTLHRNAGRAYALAMGCTALSALCLALATGDRLLLVIAVFSFFLVFNGWRALGQKRLHQRLGARWFDWLLSALTLLFSTALLWSGLRQGDVVALFFGAGGSVLAAREMRLLSGRIPSGGWLLRHLVDMGGAYIATVTAFAVVTLTFLLRPAAFIVPTLVGTPVIVRVAARMALASRDFPGAAPQKAGAPPRAAIPAGQDS